MLVLPVALDKTEIPAMKRENFFLPMALQPNTGHGLHSWFLGRTQRRTSIGRTPLDEWSARRRDLCLTTHNTHNRQTSMPPSGFESTISAGERSQTYALDRAATGTCWPETLDKENKASVAILHTPKAPVQVLNCSSLFCWCAEVK